MKKKIAKRLAQSKRKIRKRLAKRSLPDKPGPMLNCPNIHYDIDYRSGGILFGGIGVMQMLAKKLELDKAINSGLPIFKLYNPYMESDHVLNIAYNILYNGECIEDIERLRNDEVYLDAVGAKTIPDPTTAGDFCRCFSVEHVEKLQDIINEARLKVWAQQEPEFFRQAVIDADGTIKDRTFYQHNPNVTLMRTTVDECRQLGRIMAEKLNQSKRPVSVLIPQKGWSMIDAPGKPFWLPEADAEFVKALKEKIRKDIPVIEMDCNVNDEEFSGRCAVELLVNLKK